MADIDEHAGRGTRVQHHGNRDAPRASIASRGGPTYQEPRASLDDRQSAIAKQLEHLKAIELVDIDLHGQGH